MCPVPEAFDTILGHFEPTGQCSKCAGVAWNMTGGLCTDHFRVQLIESKQREVDDLWDIYGLIVYREKLADRPRPDRTGGRLNVENLRATPVRPTTTVDEDW